MPQPNTIQQVASCLHMSRLGTYSNACGGDLQEALRLYRWNLKLASALHASLSLTEVILRNAIDKQLRLWNASQPKLGGGMHGAEWLMDPARPLNTLTASSRRSARQNATKARQARHPSHPRKNAQINHDDVLAQLTFGVFAKLLPTADQLADNFRARQVVWNQALINAFPASTNDPNGVIVEGRTTRLHSLRNRVAHMEPLLDVNVSARHHDMVRLVGSINPAVQGWFAGVSKVQEVGRERP